MNRAELQLDNENPASLLTLSWPLGSTQDVERRQVLALPVMLRQSDFLMAIPASLQDEVVAASLVPG